MASEVQALVNYYARTRYPRHIQTVCAEVLKKRNNEPVLMFWRAYGLVMEGSYSEALRDLGPLLGAREVELAVPALMVHAHKQCKVVDEEAVADLQDKIRTEERNATERTKVQAATLYLQLGGWANLDRAKDMLDEVLQVQPSYPQAQNLKAWIELALEEEEAEATGGIDRALSIFNQVLAAGNREHKDLEALLGKAVCLERKEQFAPALELLNQVVVGYPWFLPALVEKARLLLALDDWEQAMETAQRILAQDAQNIEALRLTVLFLLARESRYGVAAQRIKDLCECIDRHEPKNASLYYEVSRTCSRLSGRNPAVLGEALKLVERARKLAPEVAFFVSEQAYQQSLAGDYAAAIHTYRLATQLDEANTSSMFGTVYCQLMSGELDEAAQQVDFLNEVGVDKSAELVFLTALTVWRRESDRERSCFLLDQALDTHASAMRGHRLSFEFFNQLSPELLMDMARLYLQHCGTEPRQPTEPVSPYIHKTVRVLELLSKHVPGMLEAQLMLAKTRLLAADMEGALRGASHCLRMEPMYTEAHILVAQIHLHDGKHRLAGQALEQAMSHDFAVRESPQFLIMRGKVLTTVGELEEAQKVLEQALGLPGVKAAPSKAALARKVAPVTLGERVSIFMLLAEVHTKLGHVPEATKVISDAQHLFQGTAEEVRVTIANCELALSRGDVDGALAMLKVIPKESPHYLRAKMAMADIYLRSRNDKRMFAHCYQELVDMHPDTQTFMMLGEAYMQIQEPERAIESYERALRASPRDVALQQKIGQALIMTHDYQKAVDYYEAAVRAESRQVSMQHDLAELYYKLRQYDHAYRVLDALVENYGLMEDASSMEAVVKALLLLAKVHKGKGNTQAFMQTQMEARERQLRLVNRLRGEPELARVQKEAVADICFTLAQEYDAGLNRNYEQALSFYSEALSHDPGHAKSLLSTARLHLAHNENEQVHALCVQLLRSDPDNEEASMMMAELMFRKEHYETAIYHFQQLLESKPTHYVALAQLVLLMRRAGRLAEVPRYLRMAEKSSPRAALEAGLHYCKGLHARYSNSFHEALQELNLARKDNQFGVEVLYNMVEIYLNPESDLNAGEEGTTDINMDAVRAAEKLLREVKVQPKPLKHHILECYALMATKSKEGVEEALNRLVELANTDRDSVPVLLAMAHGFTLLKQTPKARNQLKRVAKMPYNSAEGDEFERSWLLLADIHIQGGKFDLAQEMCKKCLKYNKSCAKAWEGMGQIMEREQSYRDAAEHYEMAWKYEHQASATVGYRLAFNYLKAKRYVDAIDVCHKVTAAFPQYPKIKKDVLEKARMALKP